MKAIVCTKYGPPEVLQLQDVKKPTPKNNEVLIRIVATSVTASDCIIRKLNPSPLKLRGLMIGLLLGFKKPRSSILGMVLAGNIEYAGKKVTRFKVGDAVFAQTVKSRLRLRLGAYAEYVCLPEDSLMAIKPSNLAYEEAATIPYGGLLAQYFLKKSNIQRGQNVLVYGASGSIGTSAVQLAKIFGATVTGVCSTTNLELVKSLGADTVIDYTKEDFTKTGQRYDFILNAVGTKKAQLQCENSLTLNGKHMTVDDESPTFEQEDFMLLKELTENGQLKPVIDRCYPLEQMVEAHKYVEQGHKKGNVVIIVDGTNPMI